MRFAERRLFALRQARRSRSRTSSRIRFPCTTAALGIRPAGGPHQQGQERGAAAACARHRATRTVAWRVPPRSGRAPRASRVFPIPGSPTTVECAGRGAVLARGGPELRAQLPELLRTADETAHRAVRSRSDERPACGRRTEIPPARASSDARVKIGAGPLDCLARGHARGQLELLRDEDRPFRRRLPGLSAPKTITIPSGPKRSRVPPYRSSASFGRPRVLVQQAAGAAPGGRQRAASPRVRSRAAVPAGAARGRGVGRELDEARPALDPGAARRRSTHCSSGEGSSPSSSASAKPGRPVDFQGRRLTAAAIEREHQLDRAAAPAAGGRDELLELADERGMPAEPELGVESLFDGGGCGAGRSRGCFEPSEVVLGRSSSSAGRARLIASVEAAPNALGPARSCARRDEERLEPVDVDGAAVTSASR